MPSTEPPRPRSRVASSGSDAPTTPLFRSQSYDKDAEDHNVNMQSFDEEPEDEDLNIADNAPPAFRSLEDLPEVIPTSWRPGIATGPLPVETASVDDIAIAIVAANAELSAAIQRSSALEKLHRLAREAGAVGTDRAVDTALKREGR